MRKPFVPQPSTNDPTVHPHPRKHNAGFVPTNYHNMSVNKFWTVTDGDTKHTNSRSSRFGTKQGAIHEATTRIQGGRTDEVFILESVAVVQIKKNPIEVIEI
jgi:hypothetical protein